MKQLSLLILFYPVFLFAQSSFEYVYKEDNHVWSAYSFVDNQENYITVGGEMNSTTSFLSPILLKFQDTSNIEVIKFISPDQSNVIKFGFQKENNNYIFIGESYASFPGLYILILNDDMEVLQEITYDIPDTYNYLRIEDILVEESEDIVIHGILDDPAPGNANDFFLAKINAKGQLLDSTIIAEYYWQDNSGSELLKKEDGSGYLLIGAFTAYLQLEFDNNLNLVDKLLFPTWTIFNPPLGIRQLSNGNMIIGSNPNQNVPGAYYDVRFRIVNQDYQILKDTTIFDEGKNRLPAYGGVDFVDEDNIWAVSHSSTSTSILNGHRGHIFLMDSELNIKGSKYFGGNVPKDLYTLKALEDGGCIITGTTPKSDNPDNKNIYIKKVMPEDILTHAEETPAKDDSDVSLFPNPVVDVLHIETYRKNLSIRLFDESGRSVIEQQAIHIPNTQINTSQLPCGVYIYSVYDKEKLIETGKIIKK